MFLIYFVHVIKSLIIGVRTYSIILQCHKNKIEVCGQVLYRNILMKNVHIVIIT